jgi:DNA repair protein RadB
MKIPTGCTSIDALLDGGIETDALSLFYGEAGTGKTNLCLQLTRNVARNGLRTIYIDTEGVSFDRFKQICGEDFEAVNTKILFFRPYSFEEQEKQVDEAIKVAMGVDDIGLVILDSATVFFRLKQGEMDQGRSSLSYQIIRLLTLARRKKIAVVITSQVYFNIERQEIRPLGGHTLTHNAKTIVFLEKIDTRRRRAIVTKHRAIHEGESRVFNLTANGVEG